MHATPFNVQNDLAPIPFNSELCRLAKQLKEAGLPWNPHVGCFVWDPDQSIKVTSPFPEHIYFILNLNHFLKIFGDTESIQQKLVWLPTWHQSRLVLKQFAIRDSQIEEAFKQLKVTNIDDDLILLYTLILKVLTNKR